MRALVGGAGPDWEFREMEVPTPAPGQLVIEVHAAGVNRDLRSKHTLGKTVLTMDRR